MQGLELLLDRSLADDAFKADVRAYARHHTVERIAVARHAPHVKVLRVVAQLLDAEPGLRVERVRLDAVSGCCDFCGTLFVYADGVESWFDFVWDCRWRAEVEGWVDRWGSPDQSRAAREFGWRCFSTWTRHTSAEPRRPRDAAPAAG
jgi:hypothetical protein